MRFRLAKASDSRRLAQVHRVCAAEQPESFTDRLGGAFLRQYYRVLLADRQSVVLCLVDDVDPERILGFATGTLDAAESNRTLRRNRVRLAIGALLAIMRRPGLVRGIASRYRSTGGASGDEGYVVNEGARSIYWAVLPEARKGAAALSLMKKWLALMRTMGAGEIATEVNESNAPVAQAHRLLGAELVKKVVTPDGMRRMFMQYPAPAGREGRRDAHQETT
jgi:hypothetical protein